MERIHVFYQRIVAQISILLNYLFLHCKHPLSIYFGLVIFSNLHKWESSSNYNLKYFLDKISYAKAYIVVVHCVGFDAGASQASQRGDYSTFQMDSWKSAYLSSKF
jgi:hypothetical protein